MTFHVLKNNTFLKFRIWIIRQKFLCWCMIFRQPCDEQFVHAQSQLGLAADPPMTLQKYRRIWIMNESMKGISGVLKNIERKTTYIRRNSKPWLEPNCGFCDQFHPKYWLYWHSTLCLWQDVVQQNNTLIEEMLHLIIMVVGESSVPSNFI